MELTKQQKTSIEAVQEALLLNGEVKKVVTGDRAMGGVHVTYIMTDKKAFTIDVTNLGVVSGFGSSRLGFYTPLVND